jgi:hypothetical protein
MELEPKHIIPYLPHELEMKIPKGYNFNGLRVDPHKSDKITGITCSGYISFQWVDGYYPMKDFKPIWHPLSDLTKEIEVNGQKFIPFDSMYLEAFKQVCELSVEADPSKIVQAMPYYIYQKLFEWHFNAFNLPQELWVDINTL